MLTKIQALKKMEDSMPYQLAWFTADREKMILKQKLIKKRDSYPKESNDYMLLDARINGIQAGGRVINSRETLLAKHRGIHAKKQKEEVLAKSPNHKKNRTLNILMMPGKNVKTIHRNLIAELNNIPVLY